MRVGIAAAEASRPRRDVVVVLTDGYTPWPDRQTRARLVVAIIGDRPPYRTRPHGQPRCSSPRHDTLTRSRGTQARAVRSTSAIGRARQSPPSLDWLARRGGA